MALPDVTARFDSLSPTPGTLAAAVVDALRTAATAINDQAPDDAPDTELMRVMQRLEQAGHAAVRGLNMPVRVEVGQYDELKVDALRELLAGRKLPTSGTKPELVERLEAYDRGELEPIGNNNEQG